MDGAHVEVDRADGMRRRRTRVLLTAGVLLTAVVLAGCGETAEESPGLDPIEEGTDVDGREDDGAADVSENGTGPDTDAPPEVAQAVADAAERSGRDTGDVEVVRFEQVTWPDGAIGCPEPGEMYTQALVDGYRIVVSIGDEQLTYHGADGQEPFLCEDPQPPVDAGN